MLCGYVPDFSILFQTSTPWNHPSSETISFFAKSSPTLTFLGCHPAFTENGRDIHIQTDARVQLAWLMLAPMYEPSLCDGPMASTTLLRMSLDCKLSSLFCCGTATEGELPPRQPPIVLWPVTGLLNQAARCRASFITLCRTAAPSWVRAHPELSAKTREKICRDGGRARDDSEHDRHRSREQSGCQSLRAAGFDDLAANRLAGGPLRREGGDKPTETGR